MTIATLDDVLNTEWLTIIEKQQHELEHLRWQIASVSPSPQRVLTPDQHQPLMGSAFNLSPSVQDLEPPISMDLQRYAKLCEDLEAMQSQLTSREVEVREATANSTQLRRECEDLRARLSASQIEVHQLTTDLARESSAKEQAVERAAEAIVRAEKLQSDVNLLRMTAETLRGELRTRSEMTRELERRQSRTQDDTTACRERAARLEAELTAAHDAMQRLRQDLLAEQRRVEEANTVYKLYEERQKQIESLEHILAVQTTQLQKQQAVIVEYDGIVRALQVELDAARTDMQTHAMQLFQTTLALQDAQRELAGEKQRHGEVVAQHTERQLMQQEEVIALQAWRRVAMGRFEDRELVHTEQRLLNEGLTSRVEAAEASRRRAISELAKTKRQLQQVQNSMRRVDVDLEHLNKTITQCRIRESTVSRALQEYAKRNRSLDAAVKTMQTQLRHVSDSLRRSEKRKSDLAAESTQLKRGLVIERCQRQDLLQHCIELERYLFQFQATASSSADRAGALQKENNVLQCAITELCAFSRELMESHETLQHELKDLEVQGHTEPHVFG